MRTDLPPNMQQTLYDLSPDGIVSLYRIETADHTSIFLLSPYEQITWRGNTYDSIPCQLTDVSLDSDGRATRPKFSFVNPEGLFTAAIYEGGLDNATITRYRILRGDLDANRDQAVKESFRVSRILSVTRALAVLELRDALDGHTFKLPARAFYPPEFPHVQLG